MLDISAEDPRVDGEPYVLRSALQAGRRGEPRAVRERVVPLPRLDERAPPLQVGVRVGVVRMQEVLREVVVDRREDCRQVVGPGRHPDGRALRLLLAVGEEVQERLREPRLDLRRQLVQEVEERRASRAVAPHELLASVAVAELVRHVLRRAVEEALAALGLYALQYAPRKRLAHLAVREAQLPVLDALAVLRQRIPVGVRGEVAVGQVGVVARRPRPGGIRRQVEEERVAAGRYLADAHREPALQRVADVPVVPVELVQAVAEVEKHLARVGVANRQRAVEHPVRDARHFAVLAFGHVERFAARHIGVVLLVEPPAAELALKERIDGIAEACAAAAGKRDDPVLYDVYAFLLAKGSHDVGPDELHGAVRAKLKGMGTSAR